MSALPSSSVSATSTPPPVKNPASEVGQSWAPDAMAIDPSASPLNLAQQLQMLRQAYAERLSEKVEHIIQSWEDIKSMPAGQECEEALVTLHRLTHSLAGSGATFGFQAVSDYARQAEVVLKRVTYGDEKLTPENCEIVDSGYRGLRQAILVKEDDEDDLPLAEIAPLQPHTVYLFSHEAETPPWTTSLQNFDYRIEHFHDLETLQSSCQKALPAALMIDCDTEPFLVSEGQSPLSATLHAISQLGKAPVPVLWMCRKGDLRTRLQTVRLGGSAFFTHPIDLDALLVKLDDLTRHQEPEPFRVLVVDDEPSLARLLCLILKQSGMETREVTDPFDIMGPLVDFRPDLILMDVYMPGCSGTELSRVIRQQEAYVGIPIVFLSVETDLSKQMDAMRQGGDDFLMKPVQPRHLVAAVTTRATRARVLRHLMMSDSLTGLFNHTKTTEQLAVELDRARRVGKPVSLAMIDIDSFKKINDTYGHSTGDRVLRSLSRMLSQRMRQTDVIGRYGGEEFAVIMGGAAAEDAKRVLEGVREAFSKVEHFSEGIAFHVTFSVGIASSAEFPNIRSISEAADKALYEAKRTGRNRVVVASN